MAKQANANTSTNQTAEGTAKEGENKTTEQPKEGNQPDNQNPAGGGEQQPTPKTYTEAELSAKLAAEKKTWEKAVKDAEEKAKLSETERLQRDADDLKAQLRERDARDSVRQEAEGIGAKSGDRVYKIVSGELEFDDKGKVTNLKEVLASAKTEFPELFTNKPSNSIDAGAGANSDTSALTKEKIEKMTPAEINANWEAVSKFLSSQRK